MDATIGSVVTIDLPYRFQSLRLKMDVPVKLNKTITPTVQSNSPLPCLILPIIPIFLTRLILSLVKAWNLDPIAILAMGNPLNCCPLPKLAQRQWRMQSELCFWEWVKIPIEKGF